MSFDAASGWGHVGLRREHVEAWFAASTGPDPNDPGCSLISGFGSSSP